MISVDEIGINTNFARRYKATFPILSDASKSTARAYGVLGSHNYANRWTFYIDAEGGIAHIDKDIKPLSAADDMARILRELIAKSSIPSDEDLM